MKPPVEIICFFTFSKHLMQIQVFLTDSTKVNKVYLYIYIFIYIYIYILNVIKKTLVICCLKGIILPNYVGFIANIRIPLKQSVQFECHKGFERCSHVQHEIASIFTN